MSEGIDISSWQGAINFYQVASAGKKYAIIRGGDGRYRDPNRHIYREGCLQAGLERDSYHFLRWHIPPAEMASLCEETAGAVAVPHIWSDAEDTSDYFKSIPLQGRIDWLGETLDRITSKGIKTDIYTGPWWWKGWFGNTQLFSFYRAWLAAYPFMNSLQAYTWLIAPPTCGGWTRPAIWQYSSTGHVPGVTSINCDLNWSFEPLYQQEDDMALSQAAINGLEDMFANPFIDKNGNHHTSFYAFLKQVIDWLDTTHLANLYAGLGIERDGQGNVIQNELLAKVRSLAQGGGSGSIPQPVLDALQEIHTALNNPPLAEIAKAVNDEAAERLNS